MAFPRITPPLVAALPPLAALLVTVLAFPAHAEVFNTGRTLKPGALSFSGEYQHNFSSPAALNGYVGIGLGQRVDLGLRAGLSLQDTPISYFGADVEFGLLADSERQPALSLSLGAHLIGGQQFSGDATLLLSKVLHPHFEPYLALDTNIGISPRFEVQLTAVGGLCIPIVEHFELLLEGGWSLTPSSSQYVSGGFNLYF
ncbi:hypothetical protein [Archangium sp.]|uniref:hypothetical protein n=1 Tax=Archangium sp. TaxID=1872627 RepID=UPI00286CA67F|nr:hypothetical protein [Archangium sp.]